MLRSDYFIFVKLCLFLSFVNARMISKSVDEQLLNRRVLSDLAISVCNELIAIEDEVLTRACSVNFMKADLKAESTLKREVKVRSRTQDSLQLEVTPLDSLQLVALVPADDHPGANLKHCYIHPKSNSCELSIASAHVKYAIYSTVVNRDGRTSPWQMHDTIPAWDSVPEHRGYHIKVKFLSSSVRNKVNGVFTWNHTEDSDECFDFANFCPKAGIQTLKITPDTGTEVVLERLPLDDQCFVRLTGRLGITQFDYRTPSTPPDDNTDNLTTTPEKPANISLKATKDGDDDKWTIYVGWAAPSVPPEKYNVTVRADNVSSVVVPGNETSAVVSGVSGEATYMYTVSVYAINGRHFYHKLAEAAFPQYVDSEWDWPWGEAAGGAWGAVGVLALVLWWLRVRRNTHHHPKPTDEEIKLFDSIMFEDSESEICEDQWEIKTERLVFHEVIGEGAFGVVRRGTLAPGGKDVAVKMLKDFPTLDEVRSFRFEMQLMKSVGAHPHVVSLVGCCSGKRGLIVAEYCARGDLLSCLRCSWDVMVSKHSTKYSNNNVETSENRYELFNCKLQRSQSRLVVNKMYDLQRCDSEFTSSDLLSFCRQIAMGMEFLAANRLVHRDLAARNVLVTADRTLKIADFGLSRDVYEENQYKQQGNGKMPVKWMALESLTRRIYTSQSDVWSFGVVMWEVITVGGSPYPEIPAARVPRLLRGGYRMPRPVNCSKQLYDLILSCWRAQPRKRPTFAELHQRLDELLDYACADEYLCLEMADSAPPTPKAQRYFNMLIRGKRWARDYERPLKVLQGNCNHYSSPPVTMAKAPV